MPFLHTITPLVRRGRELWDWFVTRLGLKPKLDRPASYRDDHTRITFRALIDAVIPETPELAEEFGSQHEPGGLAVDLDEFVIEYVDNLFQFGLPHVGSRGNLPIAAPTAKLLDIAALKLISRDRNESEPEVSRVREFAGPVEGSFIAVAGVAGAFSMLSRKDRLRAISLIDEFDLEVAPFRGLELEIDGGLVGQLVIGFTELLYYSEGTGYEDFFQSPSERLHSDDPATVPGWHQTGYPGVANGYAALRGYIGTEGPLGAGETWSVIDESSDPPVYVVRESGSFRENEYDTSDYQEIYPEDG